LVSPQKSFTLFFFSVSCQQKLSLDLQGKKEGK
jgi:hypothetical protein